VKYLSVCSGIEAATCAWKPLGWDAVAFSEIEKFPCSVLTHHYPNTPNYGDMTKFKEWPDADVDLLVGGTPCQSFSVAGLRKGLDDPRGNLMLTYLAIADRFKPRYLVWENVPGVLSSNGGRDFGTFLGGLAQLGYGFAYRVLDAQFVRVQSHQRAVPQRRRRVFVVGCLGDWRRAAAVLFERESLCRNTAPSRKAGEEAAGTLTRGFGERGVDSDQIANGNYAIVGIDEECNASIEHFGPLLGGGQGGTRQAVFCMSTGQSSAEIGIGVGTTLNCNHEAPIIVLEDQGGSVMNVNTSGVIGTLRRETHGHEPIICQVVHGTQDPCTSSDTAFALGRNNWQENAVCFAQNSRDELREMEVTGALAAQPGMKQTSYLRQGMAVRRLLPVECEKLQGFEPGYTLVQHNGKPAADGPRYKALGNSMAVNCMRWIGDRINLVAGIAQ
jgi:DNA (cytosine-5)-methyltransferase 1